MNARRSWIALPAVLFLVGAAAGWALSEAGSDSNEKSRPGPSRSGRHLDSRIEQLEEEVADQSGLRGGASLRRADEALTVQRLQRAFREVRLGPAVVRGERAGWT